MLNRIGIAVVIAIAVTIGCYFLGAILTAIHGIAVAVTVGDFLKNYGAVIGILAGLWSFFGGAVAPKGKE